MPSKKKKYNARFPAGRIKKIMQSDEEVGKVAQAVPIIISRTLELFVESLLTKTLKITNSRNAKTLSTSHMKQCIMSERRFDFLRELVRNIPDICVAEEAANYQEEDNQSSPEEHFADSDTPYDLSMPSTSMRAANTNAIRQVPASLHRQLPQSYQYQPQTRHTSNGQNGNNEYQRNNLKRSFSSNPNSVIMHTSLARTDCGINSIECPPPKISRSDSTPLNSKHSPADIVHPPRLKHQSYSMPSNSNDSKNISNIPNNIHPKALQIPSQPNAAIPAPILSIDYCSKPVVKIDYSNMPLSAPAQIAGLSGNNNAFDFNAEPVINIDLSNIVTSVNVPTTTASACTGATATISIGASLANTKNSSRNSKASLMTETTSYKATTKASPSVVPLTAPSSAYSCGADNSLELDEDYDNI